VSQQRLPVRKIREVLRLKAAGISDRQIAASVGSARSTVQECLRRAREAGLTWPLPEEPDDHALEARLYPCAALTTPSRPPPDFAHVHSELARPGVTRMLLWQEYKAAEPQGWQYSVFCEQYARWRCRQELVLRQNHAPGEKVFVDYAGQTVPIIDRYSGESHPAQIFVAVLGCSNYTYICATRTQSLADWLAAHVQALEFFGGVPAAVVPDNLKSAVKRAHRYEPELNPSYQDFAEHYGLAILPARVRKPRDKAKVEAGVLIVERWILARLRNRTFFSLGELNAALAELLVSLNTRAFKKLAGSRQSRVPWRSSAPAISSPLTRAHRSAASASHAAPIARSGTLPSSTRALRECWSGPPPSAPQHSRSCGCSRTCANIPRRCCEVRRASCVWHRTSVRLIWSAPASARLRSRATATVPSAPSSKGPPSMQYRVRSTLRTRTCAALATSSDNRSHPSLPPENADAD